MIKASKSVKNGGKSVRILFGEYLAAGSTPGAISLQIRKPRKRSDMRPDTLKNAKSVEELKVRDAEMRRDRRSRGGTDVKEGKTRLRGTE